MDEQIERALLLLNQNRPSEARKILQESLTQSPENDSIYGLLAQLELQEDQNEKALEYINAAIGLDPQDSDYYLTKGRIFVAKQKYSDATKSLIEAIRLDPNNAFAFAYQSLVSNHQKDFSMSLVHADKCLAIDPENVLGLNLRSTALLKLGREEEGYDTIHGALQEDPENSFTHANYGWGLLEKGEGKKSLEHFREALRLNPTNEYAQSGMAEALKSNFFIYRWFLKYQFWMANQVARNQWVFIIVFYLLFRFLRRFADANPEWSMITTPILVVAAIFAFSTWIMTPLSNLLLRVNTYGRHLLDEEERKSSTYVGFSLGIGLLSGLVYLFTKDVVSLSVFILGIAMMLPLGRYYTPSRTRNLFKIYAIGLLVVGLASVGGIALTGDLFNVISTVFLFAFIAYQWVANFQTIKE
ncbi:MAG: hypothetical protein COA58_10980 [Bacteroidetes bacterium]|nr:MAG: hypothetical protein COA58_10980 [Bacteroidota bacterium]